MKLVLKLIFLFLRDNWNKTLAVISILGVLIFSFIPGAEAYFKLFLFIGANAIIWTLIEIKAILDDKKETVYKYSNMREARPDIIQKIKNER